MDTPQALEGTVWLVLGPQEWAGASHCSISSLCCSHLPARPLATPSACHWLASLPYHARHCLHSKPYPKAGCSWKVRFSDEKKPEGSERILPVGSTALGDTSGCWGFSLCTPLWRWDPVVHTVSPLERRSPWEPDTVGGFPSRCVLSLGWLADWLGTNSQEALF